MAELWNNIMNFMKDTAFTVGNFSILWWYVIVAAVAVVVILLIVTISVAVSKSKRKQNKKKQMNKQTMQVELFKKNKTMLLHTMRYLLIGKMT